MQSTIADTLAQAHAAEAALAASLRHAAARLARAGDSLPDALAALADAAQGVKDRLGAARLDAAAVLAGLAGFAADFTAGVGEARALCPACGVRPPDLTDLCRECLESDGEAAREAEEEEAAPLSDLAAARLVCGRDLPGADAAPAPAEALEPDDPAWTPPHVEAAIKAADREEEEGAGGGLTPYLRPEVAAALAAEEAELEAPAAEEAGPEVAAPGPQPNGKRPRKGRGKRK